MLFWFLVLDLTSLAVKHLQWFLCAHFSLLLLGFSFSPLTVIHVVKPAKERLNSGDWEWDLRCFCKDNKERPNTLLEAKLASATCIVGVEQIFAAFPVIFLLEISKQDKRLTNHKMRRSKLSPWWSTGGHNAKENKRLLSFRNFTVDKINFFFFYW